LNVVPFPFAGESWHHHELLIMAWSLFGPFLVVLGAIVEEYRTKGAWRGPGSGNAWLIVLLLGWLFGVASVLYVMIAIAWAHPRST
jgi:hypothetical protein